MNFFNTRETFNFTIIINTTLTHILSSLDSSEGRGAKDMIERQTYKVRENVGMSLYKKASQELLSKNRTHWVEMLSQ